MDLNEHFDRIRGRVGLCPQKDILYEDLLGRDHLEFFGRLKGLSEEDLQAEIAHIAEQTLITGEIDKKIS